MPPTHVLQPDPDPPSSPSPLAGLSHTARSLWAKSGDETGWLSLPQHLLDSSDVAAVLWQRWASPALRHACATGCRLSVDDAGLLMSWLAGVHDIGKASKQFITQMDGDPDRSVFSQRVRDSGLDLHMRTLEASVRIPHSVASEVILHDWLTRRGMRPRIARSLACVAGSHHGVPPRPHLVDEARAILTSYNESWTAVWDEIIGFITDRTGAGPVLESLRRPILVSGQMLATGLVIMTDWIASNADAFPMTVDPDQGLRVASGCDAVDLTPPWEPVPPGPGDVDAFLRRRFSWPDEASARPTQRIVAQACWETPGPTLVIVEAPTGEGKTEAALLAVEILGACDPGSGGLLLAAPTMSTSDSLFRRTRAWAARSAVDTGEVISMFLGHSKNMLNDDYQRMRVSEVHDQTPGAPEGDGNGQVVASQWMSGRKKGLLSNVVVSTVDHVLFMALQAKHGMLRHLALAGKVVVIDEVHAYDAYMNVYLSRAIEWLAEYGASVVLLSATLPVSIKRELMESYSRGTRSRQPLPEELSSTYPLVTTLGAQGVRELQVPPRPADLRAHVSVMDDDVPTLVRTVLERTRDGGCVLVLCNTVSRAQEAYEALHEEMGEDARLVHARFVAEDRVRLETELVAELGPHSHRGQGRPKRRVVVATQVAEQSLDIDVDLLVTDIAPMDLVLQRLGRLHRHARPQEDRPVGLRRPEMLLRAVTGSGPQVDAHRTIHGAEDLFDGSTTAIYDHALLLATYATLLDGPLRDGVVTRPDDVPRLVQTVYSQSPPIPRTWAEAWGTAVKDQQKNRDRSERRASAFLLPRPTEALLLTDLFSAQDRDVADSARAEASGLAQVRDSDPSIEAVLIVDRQGGYSPLPWLADDVETVLIEDEEPGWQTAQVLARSSVRLPRKVCLGTMFDTTIDSLERATPAGWRTSVLLRGLVALRLDEDLACELSGHLLRYDRALGLREMR